MGKNEITPDEAAKLLPAGAALAWGLGKPPQRGPKREMTIEQIVRTAIEIADKDGLAAVSMNRVASALGFTAMSLYRYIPSKEDLLLLMQDAVSVFPAPTERPAAEWRESMREYVAVNIDVFVKHPWFGDLPVSGVPLGPKTLKFVDWGLRIMRDMPLNEYEKMSFVLLVSGYARSCGMIMRDMHRAIQAGSSEEAFSGLTYTTALQALVKPEAYPNLYPLVQSGAYTGENESENTVGDDFDFGLERILDGIEQYLNRKRNHSADK
ncbi:TetR/AcrR family transcriptional regulator [Cohnella lubricantis]|uniref:TetR/AcrR family transcriptional regulator n=1 Tax=Cohnella lubricantis TaxID=2163172 RepID=A0A841TK45_9BACL|nr:TetR/AcrR family transcriptional regulator [Cohnella lubricantis]MBB6679588.1 TetR/AcrR family transcriptional regulator [Cohnella lubricantis]MBP2120563.1 AcrR family transcriptional regulator [Cohnella lubricantis]